MQYLTCGKTNIPLLYVKSIAWNRRARTTQRQGGYEVPKGFETTEVTVQCLFDEGLAQALGRSIDEDLTAFNRLVTDRMDEPDTLYIGGYPVVPSLQFALTSCNKTMVYDPSYTVAMSCDLVFSGVRVSKEASRQRAMQFESDEVWDIPETVLSVQGKTLKLREMYRLSQLKRTPDSVSVVCEIADDMTVADQDGYMSRLVEDKAQLEVDFPDGKVKYWVVSASLDDNTLSLIGSILPEASQKPCVNTYWDCTMSFILKDLCSHMGVDCRCKFVDFTVDYYQNTDTPWDGVKSLVNCSGLLMSWSGNTLTFVDVPDFVAAKYELEAQTTPNDEGASVWTGCVWVDGMNRHTTGDLNGEVVHYHSSFRCSKPTPCENCLKLSRYYQRMVVVDCPINRGIVQHSAVTVDSNGTKMDGMVEEFEIDFVTEKARYEVGIIGG